ncbi:MAG: protein translocase subunit SecD [Planctomycetes bacterium]|nr:protein translocase subunit SecD [Planctomycetota bacterium]
MPHLRRYIILSLVVLTACALAIWPPERNLRLGKDLAGGVSLVYTLDVKPEDPSDVVSRSIEVIRERVNPDGLFEMTFTQQGRDRLEITMPLPNERVKKLRGVYDEKLNRLGSISVDPEALEQALRLRGEERAAALAKLGDNPERSALLKPLNDAVQKAEATAAALDAARAAGADQAKLDELVNAAGEASEALDLAKSAVVAAHVEPDDVRDALELSNQSTSVPRSESSFEMVKVPSPRERAMESIAKRIGAVPGSQAILDEIVAAHADYRKERKGYDDPADLERLLQGAGVLEFRIAVPLGADPDEQRLRRELRERGPDGVESQTTVWRPINNLKSWYQSMDQYETLVANPAAFFGNRGLVAEERDGEYYVLLRDEPGWRLTKAEGNWKLAQATQSSDQLGRPAVAFRMDERGAQLMGDLTGNHTGQAMAIVLDDEVISAPNINSRISSNGIIEGNFSPEELAYLIKTMSAGSLQAKLSTKPISKDVHAPDLGADNLTAGLEACLLSFIITAVFMVFYYFIPGGVAIIGMLSIGVMMLGIMALQRAAFSLPGIAGVALTFGMAVDSNVLIYERLREEVLKGNDPRTALRLSYQRAMSAIVDSNITTLITCVVLGYMGTAEIRGFAITLGIGVVTTLFAALVVTRICLVLAIDRWRIPGAEKSLPLVIPAIQRALSPKVDWLRLRYGFFAFSIVATALSIAAMLYQGQQIFGLEFRGGTSVTFTLKEQPGPDGKPVRLTTTRGEVQKRLQEIAAEADRNNDADLKQLVSAEVIAINPQGDGVTSDRFKIRTPVSDETKLRDAFVPKFADLVEVRQALTFANAGAERIADGAPVHQVLDNALGANFGRPDVRNNVAAFNGGAAIVLANLTPAPSEAEIEQRLAYIRSQPDFAEKSLKRTYDVVIIEGTPEKVTTAAILVKDPGVSAFDVARWREQFAQQEWTMVRTAFTQTTMLASVQSFSSAIASTFRTQAAVALFTAFGLIMIYVWMRFGSARYSLAAILPVFHDAGIAIGFIALSGWLHDHYPAVAAIGIKPFKIDLGMIAGLTTIIGYSINDTIVVLDRIRENRGKLAYATKDCINLSINQTMSRTLITGSTTILSLIIIVWLGGEGVASFAYTLLVGIIVGTYSSFALAAPLVWVKNPPVAAPFPGGPQVTGRDGSGLATT